MPNQSAIILFLLGIALIIGGIWIGQNVNLLPIEASTNAPVYDELFKVLFTIGTILFVGILIAVIYSLIQFRKKEGQSGDGIALEGNLPLEILWTAIPAVVILFVGIYSYDIYDRMGGMQSLQHEMHNHVDTQSDERIFAGIGTVPMEEAKENTLTPLPIEVTAMQFAFIFHYPIGDIISGELHVPTGQPIEMRMESNDVIHAFWVPEFSLKQDVIPGQPTILNFTPTKAGRYPIICAELCGPYHGGMRSTVVVEDPGMYQQWFRENAKDLPTEA